jgi:hypothetical protein
MDPALVAHWIAVGCFAVAAPAATAGAFAFGVWRVWLAHSRHEQERLQTATAHVEAERKLLLQRDVSAKASEAHVSRMKMLTAGREVAQAIVLDTKPTAARSERLQVEIDQWKAKAVSEGRCICGGPRADGQHDRSCPKRVNIPHDSYAGSDFDPQGRCECANCQALAAKPKLDSSAVYAPGPTGGFDVMVKTYEALLHANPGMGKHNALIKAMDSSRAQVDSSRIAPVDSSRSSSHGIQCNCDSCWSDVGVHG